MSASNVSPKEKEILDMLYETVVDLSFTFAYALGGKKILGISRPSAKMNMNDVLKMTAYFSAGRASREMAVKKGWLPASIVPKPK